MMLLLLFTCNILILQYVECYHHNYPQGRVVRNLFEEDRVDRFFRKPERIDGFVDPSGDSLNQLGGFGQPNAGFDWTGGDDDGRDAKGLRIFRQSDFVFDEDNEFNDVVVPNGPPAIQTFSTSTAPSIPRPGGSPVRVPGMATTRSPCEDMCRATTQFDPVCGDNNVTYTNIYWLRCAQRCGRNVNIKFRGSCPRVP